MKKNSAFKTFAVIALLNFGLSALHGQDKNIPIPYREKVNVLYEKVKNDFFSLPITDIPCPLQSDKNELAKDKPLETWWLTLEQLRTNGEQECCFRLLNALEPIVQDDKKAYLKWLFEKSHTLNTFQYKDSALVVAQLLHQKADQYGQFQGWAALIEARVSRSKRQFVATMQLAEKALDIARKENDKRLEEKVLNIMGVAARDIYMVRPDKNVPFLEKALHIAAELKDTSAMISNLISIAISYDETPENDKLFDYTEGAIALLKPTAPLTDRMLCIRLLTIYLHSKKDFNRSLLLYAHAIEMMKKLGNKALVQNTFEQVAGIYLEQKEYDNALSMMDSARVYSDFKSELGYFYRTYADIYHAKGDEANAIKYYQIAFDEQVKGYTNRNSALLTEMETRMRTRETEIMLEEQTKQRWLLFGLVLLLCLLTIGAVYAYLRKKKISEKIEAQRNLIEKQADELRHLDEAKTRFFANVSHELRTPLTLMLGPLASMLKRNRLENTDFTYAKTAQTHAKDLLKLVNEILDLSKIESGRMQIQETTVSLQPFTRRLVSTFESHAERLGIHYQFEYHAEKRLRLVVDTEKLTRIVNNLVSNAMKFTPRGGSVVFIVEDLSKNIRFTVKDTGRGIHADDLPSIFDRFYQTNQADAPVEGGTGIGLALCREFAEVLNGRLWAESELGQGSQFYFEFPKKEVLGVGNESEFTTDLMDEELTEGGIATVTTGTTESYLVATDLNNIDGFPNLMHNPTLLIVEDNYDLRAYIASILRGANYNILEAENGLEALDILQNCMNSKQESQIPKLIISDIMMPVMDGFQLLKVLKDSSYFNHIPVVMLTARADIQDKLTALRIGVDDYLLKPFEEEELLARVENLLRNYNSRFLLTQNTSTETTDIAENKTETIDNQIFNYTQKDLDWLTELEKVVASSMAQFDFNTEGVAEKLFMGRSQFFKKVKQLTGITPNEYVQEMRLNHARTLLENRRTATVKETAYSVGFKDVRYFSELFKKRFGKLPSEYLG